MRYLVSLLFCWAFRWLDGPDARLIITEKAAAADDLGYGDVRSILDDCTLTRQERAEFREIEKEFGR